MAEPWSAGRWSVGLEYVVDAVRSGSLSTGREGTSDGGRRLSTNGCQYFFALEASMAEPQRTMFHPKKKPFSDSSDLETLMVQFPTGFSPLHQIRSSLEDVGTIKSHKTYQCLIVMNLHPGNPVSASSSTRVLARTLLIPLGLTSSTATFPRVG